MNGSSCGNKRISRLDKQNDTKRSRQFVGCESTRDFHHDFVPRSHSAAHVRVPPRREETAAFTGLLRARVVQPHVPTLEADQISRRLGRRVCSLSDSASVGTKVRRRGAEPRIKEARVANRLFVWFV